MKNRIILKLTLILLKYNFKKLEVKFEKEDNAIVKKAFGMVIENYKTTIMHTESMLSAISKKKQ